MPHIVFCLHQTLTNQFLLSYGTHIFDVLSKVEFDWGSDVHQKTYLVDDYESIRWLCLKNLVSYPHPCLLMHAYL